jgi:hypothetical protein
MSAGPQMLFRIPSSADSAQRTISVDRRTRYRRGDKETELLFNAIALAYRDYHESDSAWTLTRYGTPRLRLVGKHGSALLPRRRFASVDLEDL